MLMGRKIGLRKIEPPDLWTLWAWHEQEDLYLFRRAGAFVTLDELSARFAELFRWKGDFIAEAADGEAVALCSYQNIVWKNRSCDLAFQAPPGAPSRSHASDAVMTLLDFLFEELDMARVSAFTPASFEFHISVLYENGFKREGTLREHVFRDGVYEDVRTWGILKKEHERRKGP
eukprot:NODE_1013_length_687_cov_1.207447_g1004_i0.p1 GENE.NODE_1013_length_687_cov_1.207447_g1004_i0~~NODE_1013_length_687_cov_1.207447_g1004_i0.p1  ORF type:complete len:175 (+),score=55.68 NODE_1013_length_687_cov_1.207447_g1004_i0:86-610(+)